MMAAERLGELRRLAVADARRDVAHRHRPGLEKLERAPHADLGHVRAEARVADLAERPLQLAARSRETPSDMVQLEVCRVLVLDDLFCLFEQSASALFGSVPHSPHPGFFVTTLD